MTLLKTIAAALIGAVLAAIAVTGAAAQEYVFKLHHLLAGAAPAQTQMLEPWARKVEENSGGRVKIEIYPAMSLGGRPPELIQQVRDGVVDLIWTVNGYTPGLFPRSEVFELPGIAQGDPAVTNAALYDMYTAGDFGDEFKGTEVMWLHVHAGQAIYMRDKLVREPADLEGVKMRIPTRTGAWIIEALGASPAAMPVPELPQALSKGVVDGAFIPWEIGAALKLQDQVKYLIEGPDMKRFGTTTFQVSMNKARWDSLPEDIQKAFKDASGPDWWTEVGTIWRAIDDKGLEIMTGAGSEHVVLTDEEYGKFETTMEPVVQRWVDDVTAQGIDGAALVEKARAGIASHASN
jgi:TRAP-type C4-dicarboxylate transport system substrate-binding protein